MQRSFSEYYFFKYKAFGAFSGGETRKNEEGELFLSSFLHDNDVIRSHNSFSDLLSSFKKDLIKLSFESYKESYFKNLIDVSEHVSQSLL